MSSVSDQARSVRKTRLKKARSYGVLLCGPSLPDSLPAWLHASWGGIMINMCMVKRRRRKAGHQALLRPDLTTFPTWAHPCSTLYVPAFFTA